MNYLELNTKEKLQEYGEKVLVVTENINNNPYTNNSRCVALLGFINDFIGNQNISLHCAVYDLDQNGDPIITEALKPYEVLITASNNTWIDLDTGDIIDDESKKIPGHNYMTEYDYFLEKSKSESLDLFDLFETSIVNSSKINPPQQ